eukprot:821417_1
MNDTSEDDDAFDLGSLVLSKRQTLVCSNGAWTSQLKDCDVQTITYDGGKYVGQLNGKRKPHGKGTMTWANNDWYEGNWADGKLNGKGSFISETGACYEGRFVQGERHGKGMFTYPDEQKPVYNGKWSKDKRHGQGTLTW